MKKALWASARLACELCGKSRIEFLHVLKEDGVFLNYDDAELDRDLANMESFR